jgi:sigma-B regulation protein RsbU (phosphoserine phosphatase)
MTVAPPGADNHHMKVLLADDDPVTRALYSRLMRNWGCDVLEAEDGLEALAILERQAIHFVISDWLMPKMTGLELCRRIRESGADHYTYIILCTSKGAKKDLIVGMEAGADDFLVKPFSTEELRVRVHAGERVVNLEQGLALKNRELAAVNAKLQQAYVRIEDDLKAAAWMQASLLPAASPKALGVSSEWRFRPSRYVAGDTLNVFPIDENQLAFYLLDVSGHGVPAAMLSVTLSMLLTPDNTPGSPLKRFDAASQAYVTVPPEDAVAELNRRFQSRDDQYFTMIYGLLETRDLTLRFSQAGHPNPLLIEKGCLRVLGAGGSPVGILPQAQFDSVQVQLHPGDRLVLYSDGVTECTNPAGDLYGEQRLRQYLTHAGAKPLSDMLGGLETEIETWRGKREFDDDISLLALEVGA